MALLLATPALCGNPASCSGLTSIEKSTAASAFRVSAGPIVKCKIAGVRASSENSETTSVSAGRRQAALTGLAAVLAVVATPLPARADFLENYTAETKDVIEKVKATLNLGRDDPTQPDSVNALRVLSNDWVAKYRREKSVAGKPSFSNMYSALNAISGHYISFGNSYPIPKKRAQRILEEVSDAERALSRGR